VRCLYCGKEIGAFRLLRDSEFCSAPHRKKYGERLGKALHEIAAPEPAPAGVAGFRDQMPFQQGNLTSTLVLWQAIPARNRIRTSNRWLLTIDTSDPRSEQAPIPPSAPIDCPSLNERWIVAPAPEPVATLVETSVALAPMYTRRTPRFAAELEPTPFLDAARHAPAPYHNWMPVPAPEPVAAFVLSSVALAPAYQPFFPRFAAELEPTPFLDTTRHAPAPDDNWMSVPAPEPVAAFVQPSEAVTPVHTLRLPRFVAELEPTPFLDVALNTPSVCERWVAGPVPEPVTAFVQPSASLAPAPYVMTGLRLPGFTAEWEPIPLLCLAPPAPVPQPELVAAFVQTTAALNQAYVPHVLCLETGSPLAPLQDAYPAESAFWMTNNAHGALLADAPGPAYTLSMDPAGLPPRMPAPEFTAELEPFPVPDDPLEVPAMCGQWMPAPGADPVFSYLQASVAPAVAVYPAWHAPVFALPLAGPRMPWNAQAHPVSHAAPVMTAVQPDAASTPLLPIPLEGAMTLPVLPQVTQELFEAARPASASAPEAVESWVVAAQSAAPLSMDREPCRGVDPSPPNSTFEPAPALGGPLTGPAPAALESLLIASMAAPVARAVFLPQFALAVPGGSAQGLRSEPRASAAGIPVAPNLAAIGLAAPRPIATLAVRPPALVRLPLDSVLPRPDLLPIEFHVNRGRGAPAGRPEWRLPRPALLPPRFLMNPVLEKLEDPAAREKTARKKPEVVEIPNMPTAKRPPTVLMVFFRVAAGFLLAVSLWSGMASFRGDHRLAAREASPADAALSTSTSERTGLPGGAAAAHPETKGAVAWVRQTIAHRAALKIAENFRDLENWDSPAKARPSGWSRDADGYMKTGALALFRPTLKFTDYRMEFFGQIENKSIGWTVRATDSRNYHAMKLTVLEAGLRPFVALVHYDVVDGKSGHRTQTPLNVMVHNNTPIQFAVDVRGNRFVTSIDGEEVDSFIDTKLVAGGVGFFSEAGERARLYWMRVSRNDDFLGHVCAMLAEGTAATAELRKPELPGVPAPGLPADRDGTSLAAMWVGLPYLGATRKTRYFKTWRCKPWNT
jgi:hypothetical protein